MTPVPSQARWVLPRLTARVFTDLAIWMVGFGLLIGVIFPFVLPLAGVPTERSAQLFAFTLSAGLVVGAVNYGLARLIVGRRLMEVRDRMRYVAASIEQATDDGDWTRCSPEQCHLDVSSDDVLGELADSFNRLVQALAASRSEAQAQQDYAHVMARHLDLDELADAVLHGVLDAVGADAGAVMISADGTLRTAASHRLQQDPDPDSSMVAHALRHHETTLTDLPAGLVVDAGVVDFRPSFVAAVPMMFADTPVGVVLLAFSVRPEPGRLARLEHLRDPTGVALHNALIHERFQRLAAIDPLTGVYNRRFGTARLREELARSVRGGTPLGVLTFDLDHFKRVNDTHGHLVGDQVLRETARAVERVLRAGDVLVRTGGEEFVAILPGAGIDDVRELGERLRAAVAATTVHAGQVELRVTVSVGGAAFPTSADGGMDDLLEAADQALYRAKREGRNRTLVA